MHSFYIEEIIMSGLNKEDIVLGLQQMGIKQGMDIEVHSSLSSIGYVNGGAEIVIQALKEVVGSEGSIFMPTLRLSRICRWMKKIKQTACLGK